MIEDKKNRVGNFIIYDICKVYIRKSPMWKNFQYVSACHNLKDRDNGWLIMTVLSYEYEKLLFFLNIHLSVILLVCCYVHHVMPNVNLQWHIHIIFSFKQTTFVPLLFPNGVIVGSAVAKTALSICLLWQPGCCRKQKQPQEFSFTWKIWSQCCDKGKDYTPGCINKLAGIVTSRKKSWFWALSSHINWIMDFDAHQSALH